MRNCFIFFLGASSIFIVPGCKEQPETASEAEIAFNMDSARASISSSLTRLTEAVQRGDSTTIASFYTSEAQIFPPNSEPISGPTGIISFFGAGMRMGIKNAKIITTELYGGEDGLTEIGNYELSGEGGKILDRGKYIALWKKENGVWKMYRDMSNSNMPVPSSGK